MPQDEAVPFAALSSLSYASSVPNSMTGPSGPELRSLVRSKGRLLLTRVQDLAILGVRK